MNKNKQQAIEDYFRALAEAKGTQFRELIFGGYSEFECLTDRVSAVRIDGIWVRFESLPNIIDHFPSFKKWVLEKMGDKFWFTTVYMNGQGEDGGWCWMARWQPHISKTKIVKCGEDLILEPILDGEITLAAVKAATRYWGEKNAEGS